MSIEGYLVLANPSNKHNLGTLIRCAAAFGVAEVVVVGASKWSTHGAHGSHKHVKYRWFNDWESAAAFLRTEKDCDLCGIVQSTPASLPSSEGRFSTEVVSTDDVADAKVPCDAGKNAESHSNLKVGIVPAANGTGDLAERSEQGSDDESDDGSEENSEDECEGQRCGGTTTYRASTAVRRRPFRKSTAFLVGHRSRLEDKALDVCDFFVHVEQMNEFPMELGPPVTTSIALHHFTAWARLEERRFTGEKFNVDGEVARSRPPDNKKSALTEERVRLREELRAADPLEAGGGRGNKDVECGAGMRWLSGDVDGDAVQGDY